MTDSEQTSEYECENSSPGQQNPPPQNQPTQWVQLKQIRPISQVKFHECLCLSRDIKKKKRKKKMYTWIKINILHLKHIYILNVL